MQKVLSKQWKLQTECNLHGQFKEPMSLYVLIRNLESHNKLLMMSYTSYYDLLWADNQISNTLMYNMSNYR